MIFKSVVTEKILSYLCEMNLTFLNYVYFYK